MNTINSMHGNQYRLKIHKSVCQVNKGRWLKNNYNVRFIINITLYKYANVTNGPSNQT